MSDLLNGFNNGRDKSDGIGGNKPIDQLANDVDTSESGLHLQNVMKSPCPHCMGIGVIQNELPSIGTTECEYCKGKGVL